MEYIWCAESVEYLSEMNMAKDEFKNMMIEFQSYNDCKILQIDRLRLQLKKGKQFLHKISDNKF